MAKTVDDIYEEAYPARRATGRPLVYGTVVAPPAALEAGARVSIAPDGMVGPADAVAHPGHYTSHPSGIEVIDITRHESFLRGNILKYVLRAPYKGHEVEDLKKARQYLDWEIERAQGEEESNGAAHR